MRSKRSSRTTTNLIERVRSILASKDLTLHQASRKSEMLYGRSSPYFLPHNLYFDLRLGTSSPSIYQVASLSRISGYRLADWLQVFGFHLEDISRLQIQLPSNRTVLLNSSLDDPNAWVPWLDNRPRTTPAPPVAPLAHLLEFTHRRRLRSLSEIEGRGFLYAKIGNDDVLPLSPALTMAVLPLVPAFLIVRYRFRRRLTIDSDIVQADRIAWNAFLEEHLSSVIPIQLLGQQGQQQRRAFQLLARAVRSQQNLFKSGTWFTIGSSLAVSLSMCAVIGYGGLRALAGALSVGSLVAFYGFVTQLFDPLSGAVELYARAQRTFASVRQVQSALALQPTILDATSPISLSQTHPPRIDFDGVEFGYPRYKDMLHVPSLRVLPGERLAIAGENGSGKSTLAKLIARLYEVDAGSISIGGEDIRRLELRSLRRYICYLPRDPILFSGTLASNLHFVRPTASSHELEEAILCAGLSAFVSTLPDGLHQRIGAGACQLSGGQRQRLAIARALLLKPQILILDEATSCLDPPSEKLLLWNIRRTICASTLIVISHRLSTLTAFERVLVLRRGKIAADGNPDSFVGADNAYSKLFDPAPSTTTVDL